MNEEQHSVSGILSEAISCYARGLTGLDEEPWRETIASWARAARAMEDKIVMLEKENSFLDRTSREKKR